MKQILTTKYKNADGNSVNGPFFLSEQRINPFVINNLTLSIMEQTITSVPNTSSVEGYDYWADFWKNLLILEYKVIGGAKWEPLAPPLQVSQTQPSESISTWSLELVWEDTEFYSGLPITSGGFEIRATIKELRTVTDESTGSQSAEVFSEAQIAEWVSEDADSWFNNRTHITAIEHPRITLADENNNRQLVLHSDNSSVGTYDVLHYSFIENIAGASMLQPKWFLTKINSSISSADGIRIENSSTVEADVGQGAQLNYTLPYNWGYDLDKDSNDWDLASKDNGRWRLTSFENPQQISTIRWKESTTKLNSGVSNSQSPMSYIESDRHREVFNQSVGTGKWYTNFRTRWTGKSFSYYNDRDGISVYPGNDGKNNAAVVFTVPVEGEYTISLSQSAIIHEAINNGFTVRLNIYKNGQQVNENGWIIDHTKENNSVSIGWSLDKCYINDLIACVFTLVDPSENGSFDECPLVLLKSLSLSTTDGGGGLPIEFDQARSASLQISPVEEAATDINQRNLCNVSYNAQGTNDTVTRRFALSELPKATHGRASIELSAEFEYYIYTLDTEDDKAKIQITLPAPVEMGSFDYQYGTRPVLIATEFIPTEPVNKEESNDPDI